MNRKLPRNILTPDLIGFEKEYREYFRKIDPVKFYQELNSIIKNYSHTTDQRQVLKYLVILKEAQFAYTRRPLLKTLIMPHLIEEFFYTEISKLRNRLLPHSPTERKRLLRPKSEELTHDDQELL